MADVAFANNRPDLVVDHFYAFPHSIPWGSELRKNNLRLRSSSIAGATTWICLFSVKTGITVARASKLQRVPCDGAS